MVELSEKKQEVFYTSASFGRRKAIYFCETLEEAKKYANRNGHKWEIQKGLAYIEMGLKVFKNTDHKNYNE